jgi:hypothetical protein
MCTFCDDPVDETEIGARSGDVIACADCYSLGESDG